MGHAVGLSPQSYFSRCIEGAVYGREEFVSIEGDCEPVIFGLQSQCVPVVGGDFDVRTVKLFPLPLDHAIEPNIVLESIRTDHVIVVWRGEPDDDSTSLVNRSGGRLEPQVDIDVLG